MKKGVGLFIHLAYVVLQNLQSRVEKRSTHARYYIDLNILKQIYYALKYPYLSYGNLAWGCASKTRLDCLRIKHNKCLRTIFFVQPRESAAPYFKLLTILKLDNKNIN